MTNQEIKKYKERLAVIVKECNELLISNDDSTEKHIKLDRMVGSLQELSVDICAPTQLGKDVIDLKEKLLNAWEKKLEGYDLQIAQSIFKLYYTNILYTLQTEMMLNACVSAKRSCFWAAIAALVSFIGIILTWYLK